jgi:class 3 adenylate cyclase
VSSAEVDRHLAVIWAADVAGYSRLMSDDEEATLATLATYQEVIAGLVAEHQPNFRHGRRQYHGGVRERGAGRREPRAGIGFRRRAQISLRRLRGIC